MVPPAELVSKSSGLLGYIARAGYNVNHTHRHLAAALYTSRTDRRGVAIP